MRKKNGFTLVELLSTIVILGVILSITAYLVIRNINKAKDDAKLITYNNIKSAAKVYNDEVAGYWSIKDDYEYSCISLGDMIENGYFKEDTINKNDKLSKNTKIKVIRDKNSKVIKETSFSFEDSILPDVNCAYQAGVSISTDNKGEKVKVTNAKILYSVLNSEYYRYIYLSGFDENTVTTSDVIYSCESIGNCTESTVSNLEVGHWYLTNSDVVRLSIESNGIISVFVNYNGENVAEVTKNIDFIDNKFSVLLYDYIKDNADTTTQIDFSKTSEASNTNGIYTTTDTDSGVPVYYYRGSVDNHVLFANFCWKIVRTTETKGVKLIYDGMPNNGKCNNIERPTEIGVANFNSSVKDVRAAGYMYGNSIDDPANTTDSTIKTVIDAWYKSNMNDYTLQLEDTVFCNDRSYIKGEPPYLYFGAYTRLVTNKKPTLKCKNTKDKFTVDTINGNGTLTYPVGLITADEIAYAGGVYEITNNSFYLYTGQSTYWTLSPSELPYSPPPGIFCLDNLPLGELSQVLYDISTASSVGVRPVVSLKYGALILDGSGTAELPFILG